MEIRITGKNIEITEEVKEWVTRKASKLEHFGPRLVESHVIIKREKHFYIVELTLLAPHLRAYGEGRHRENLLTAIDVACDRVATQLKKFREKLKSHE
jgi:putative sigma-54 modulation protein